MANIEKFKVNAKERDIRIPISQELTSGTDTVPSNDVIYNFANNNSNVIVTLWSDSTFVFNPETKRVYLSGLNIVKNNTKLKEYATSAIKKDLEQTHTGDYIDLSSITTSCLFVYNTANDKFSLVHTTEKSIDDIVILYYLGTKNILMYVNEVILQKMLSYREYNHNVGINNEDLNGITIDNNKVIVNKNGFRFELNKTWYIKSISSDTTVFDFNIIPDDTTTYLVIDYSVLYSKSTSVVEASEVMKIIKSETFKNNKLNYLPVAYNYKHNGVRLTKFINQFNDLYSGEVYDINCRPYLLDNTVFMYASGSSNSDIKLYLKGINLYQSGYQNDFSLSVILEQLNQDPEQDYIHIPNIQCFVYNYKLHKFKVLNPKNLEQYDIVLYSSRERSSLFDRYRKLPFNIMINNGIERSVNVVGNQVTIGRNGFYIFNNTIIRPKETPYCVKYTLTDCQVLCVDYSKVAPIILKEWSVSKFLIIDPTEALSIVDRMLVDTNHHLPIAYYSRTDNKTVLVEPFKTIFGHNKQKEIQEALFLPDYYSYCAGRNTTETGGSQNWFKRFGILHISDTHNYYNDIEEALTVCSSLADAVCHTGDISNGSTANTVEHISETISEYKDAILRSTIEKPVVGVLGNHDYAMPKDRYFSEMCSFLKEQSENIVWGDEANNRNYGYIDIQHSGTGTYRIIMLDTKDTDDITWKCIFSPKQINWLITVLRDAANKQYHVITLSHFPFGDGSNFTYHNMDWDKQPIKTDITYCQDAFMVPDIIDAMQHKSALTKTYMDSSAEKLNIVINEDFSNLQHPLDFVVHLFGHIHRKLQHRCQKSDGSKKYDILMLQENAIGQIGHVVDTYYAPNSINNIAFSMLEVDPQEKCIYRISYGRYKTFDDTENQHRVTKIPYRFND